MKLRRLVVIIIVLGLSAVATGAGADSTENDRIKKRFMDFADCYNKSESDKVLAFFDEAAQIKTGWPGEFVSKEKYATILPQRMKVIERVSFSNYRINLDGGKARVKVKWHVGPSRALKARFDLVNKTGRWLILKQDY